MADFVELADGDLSFVVSRLPRDVIPFLKEYTLVLAGGFIRDTILGEKPSDIDLFGYKDYPKADIHTAIRDFGIMELKRGHVSANAVTFPRHPRMAVQFITRWEYAAPSEVVESFDFTVCQAVIWHENGRWHSRCSPRFYSDLAARRLYYTSPVRDEAPGGSLLRVLKMVKRGYNIQAKSYAEVIARMLDGVEGLPHVTPGGISVKNIVFSLLREVDPALMSDGGMPLGEKDDDHQEA